MAELGKTIGEIIAGTANNSRAIDALTGKTLGTEPHMLHRQDASDTSVQAAYSIDTASIEERVLGVIRAAGMDGITQDGILDAMPGIGYPTVTARLPALLRKGLIIDTGKRRPGRSGRSQRVIRATGGAA